MVKARQQTAGNPPLGGYRPVMKESFGYIIPCPECEKRAYDISELPEQFITLKLKCPHCSKIVETPIFIGLADELSVFICK